MMLRESNEAMCIKYKYLVTKFSKKLGIIIISSIVIFLITIITNAVVCIYALMNAR